MFSPSLRFNEFLCFPENSTAGSCPNFRNFSSVSPLSSLDLPGTGWSDAWFMKGFWADILHQVCSRSSGDIVHLSCTQLSLEQPLCSDL